MPEEVNPDTNFKVIDKRSPETQARVAEMAGDHTGDANEMVLKPCPFCGGRAILNSGEDVECEDCGIYMVRRCGSFSDAGLASDWNRRTPEPGTSVVRWVRYDETEGTLPKDREQVLLFCVDGLMQCEFYFFGGPKWRNPLIEFPATIGDLWTYPPEPPEGMG